MTSSGRNFCGARFIWAFALMLAMAAVPDGLAATKPAPKAKITVQPVKQVADLGGSASLMVAAISPSTISYQWRLNKIAISGANSASYVINPVTADSAGNYDVVLTNAGGAVTSKQAMLTVDLAPPSLPVGTALYDEITVRTMGQSSAETGGWMVSSATVVTDPEDNTGSYTFTYKYVSVNRATLTITGSFYDSSVGGRVGATTIYTLVFTGISPGGNLECTCSGKGALTAPAGYRPAKVPFTFSGTTAIDLPAPQASLSGGNVNHYMTLTLSGSTTLNYGSDTSAGSFGSSSASSSLSIANPITVTGEGGFTILGNSSSSLVIGQKN